MMKRLLALLSMIPFLSAWANKPRLTLVQRWNVNTLLGLLEDLPDENYNHSVFGFNGLGGCYHNSGCAGGLARANYSKFFTSFGRRAGVEATAYGRMGEFSESVFGKGAFATVFDIWAYRDQHYPTKKVVIDRLKAYAYEGYRQ